MDGGERKREKCKEEENNGENYKAEKNKGTTTQDKELDSVSDEHVCRRGVKHGQ